MQTTGVPGTTAVPAAIAFTHCVMTAAAAAAGTTHGHAHAHGRRREVVVNGKRVKTIDVHAHCCVPKAMAVVNHPLEAPGLLMDDTSTRIAAMDSQGIDVEALSINPYWYAECGASQIMMGTDFPYPWTSTAVEHILATSSLSEAERAAILGDNACKLLRITS